MKQLSKMMLAAVASVALAAPALAWDFSASGAAQANFNSQSTTTITGATAASGGGVTSAGGGLTLKSSHTDGAKTATLSYVIDWDGNLDETITVAGSNKVGDWTASGSVAYSRGNVGCSERRENTYTEDNVTISTTASGTRDNATSTTTACAGAQTGEDATSVTLTDGTMTVILGEAAHLSGQNVSSNGAADGALSMDAHDEDLGIGAFVGSFHGVSVGYKINDDMSVTGAFQSSSEASDMLGAGEFLDAETTASHGTTGYGVSFKGTFGPATVGITQGNAATADNTGSAVLGLKSTTMSTFGLGVSLNLGDIKPFISVGSYAADGSASKAQHTHSGQEAGLTYALGDDTIVVYLGQSEDKYSTTDKALTKSGMEVGYSTTVGPASLMFGYGEASSADADKPTDSGTTYTKNDGYKKTDIEVRLTFSF